MRRESLLFVALALPIGRPDVEIRGFDMNESKGGVRSLEMLADTSELFKSAGLAGLKNLQIRLWTEYSTAPYEISGKSGVLNTENQDFEIPAEAKVKSPDGYLFEAPDLFYLAAKRELSSDKEIKARSVTKDAPSQLKMSGIGLNIKLNLGTYEIQKKVRAEQRTGPKNILYISSNSSVITPRTAHSEFFRNVSVRSADMELTGQYLKLIFTNANDKAPDGSSSSRPKQMILGNSSNYKNSQGTIEAVLAKLKIKSKGLVIDFGAEGNLKRTEAIGGATGEAADGVGLKAETLVSEPINGVDRILLKDNAQIVTGTRIGTCQQAEFYPDTGEIILEKIASVKNGNQVIRGERIRLSTRNSEIVVEKAEGTMEKSDINPRKN